MFEICLPSSTCSRSAKKFRLTLKDITFVLFFWVSMVVNQGCFCLYSLLCERVQICEKSVIILMGEKMTHFWLKLPTSGFEITFRNNCDGDIFKHNFRIKPATIMLKYNSIIVVFLHYFEHCFHWSEITVEEWCFRVFATIIMSVV